MRQSRSSGSGEGVMGNHDSYSNLEALSVVVAHYVLSSSSSALASFRSAVSKPLGNQPWISAKGGSGLSDPDPVASAWR
jgi:hypothetical protein